MWSEETITNSTILGLKGGGGGQAGGWAQSWTFQHSEKEIS